MINLDIYKDSVINRERLDGKAGIYAIKLNGQIVYIGKSVNMLNRAAQHTKDYQANTHLHSSNKYQILSQAWERDVPIEFDPLYYALSPEPEEEIGEVEGILIRHYMPILNYQIPKQENWHQFTTNPIASTITFGEVMELIKDKKTGGK